MVFFYNIHHRFNRLDQVLNLIEFVNLFIHNMFNSNTTEKVTVFYNFVCDHPPGASGMLAEKSIINMCTIFFARFFPSFKMKWHSVGKSAIEIKDKAFYARLNIVLHSLLLIKASKVK